MEKVGFSCQISRQELILDSSSPEYPQSRQSIMENWGGRRLKGEKQLQLCSGPGNSHTQLLVEQCSELLGANRSHNYFHQILSTVNHKTQDTAKGPLSQIWLADSRVGRTHPFHSQQLLWGAGNKWEMLFLSNWLQRPRNSCGIVPPGLCHAVTSIVSSVEAVCSECHLQQHQCELTPFVAGWVSLLW